MFCTASYNGRRQRVLEAKTPDPVVAERFTVKPALAKDKPAGRARLCDIIKARLSADRAKEVSQLVVRHSDFDRYLFREKSGKSSR